VTKFCVGTLFRSQVMNCQTHAIGKAIRPLFAEPVTNRDLWFTSPPQRSLLVFWLFSVIPIFAFKFPIFYFTIRI